MKTSRGVGVGAALVAAVAAGLVSFALVGASTAPASAKMPTSVPVGLLAQRGVTIAIAVGAPADALSQTAAMSIGRTPDVASVKSATLVHFTDGYSRRQCLCWMLQTVPVGGNWSDGPEGSKPIQGTYSLEFIDAVTGAYIEGMQGR
jgi:hypothetical protein